MARVNVEERFFADHPRHRRVAELMGWKVREVKGCLLDLWFYSQEALKTHGTAEQIAFWAQIDDQAERAKLVTALADELAHFIEKVGEDRYEISGNEEQISNRVGNIDGKKKGGRATREKWRRLKELANQQHDARLDSLQPALGQQAASTPIQGSSMQPNAGQGRAIQPAPPVAGTPSPDQMAKCIETWLGTLKHFKIERALGPTEELAILRALRIHGFEMVDLALFGARYEQAFDDFKPADHLAIERFLTKDRSGKERIDKFANLGAAARAKLQAKAQKAHSEAIGEPEAPVLCPEEVRAMLAKAGFPRPDSELAEGQKPQGE